MHYILCIFVICKYIHIYMYIFMIYIYYYRCIPYTVCKHSYFWGMPIPPCDLTMAHMEHKKKRRLWKMIFAWIWPWIPLFKTTRWNGLDKPLSSCIVTDISCLWIDEVFPPQSKQFQSFLMIFSWDYPASRANHIHFLKNFNSNLPISTYSSWYYIILYYIISYYILLYYNILYYIILY